MTENTNQNHTGQIDMFGVEIPQRCLEISIEKDKCHAAFNAIFDVAMAQWESLFPGQPVPQHNGVTTVAFIVETICARITELHSEYCDNYPA